MKPLKIITAALSAVSGMFTALIPAVSSYMQDYYKGQLPALTKNAEELLEKKQFWSQLGETHIFLYIFLTCITVLVTVSSVHKERLA